MQQNSIPYFSYHFTAFTKNPMSLHNFGKMARFSSPEVYLHWDTPDWSAPTVSNKREDDVNLKIKAVARLTIWKVLLGCTINCSLCN